MTSRHEALGILTEEFHELVEAVRSNDSENFEEELWDIAAGSMAVIWTLLNDSEDC